MLGLSAADRIRLDNVAQAAATALTRLEAHEVRCTDRYGEIKEALADQRRQRDADTNERRAAMKRLFWMVLTVVVMVLSTIIKDLVNRGLAQ